MGRQWDLQHLQEPLSRFGLAAYSWKFLPKSSRLSPSWQQELRGHQSTTDGRAGFGSAETVVTDLLSTRTRVNNHRRKGRTDEVRPAFKEKRAGGGPASKENTKHNVGSLHNGT